MIANWRQALRRDAARLVVRHASTSSGRRAPRFARRRYGGDDRLGYSMTELEATALKLQIEVEAERRQLPTVVLQKDATGRDQRVLGRANVEW